MSSFLDKDGVTYLWGKFKSFFNAHVKTDVPANAVFTDTTYSAFTGTDGTVAGASGLVPAPSASDANKVLKSDGTWANIGGGGANLIDMTQSEYDVLTTSEKTNGSAYFIKRLEGGESTKNLTLTFLNNTTVWEVGENFVFAEGQMQHDSRYGCIVEVVDSTTVRYSRTFNGTPQAWQMGNYYDGQNITFTSAFVQGYMGTSTVDFECTYEEELVSYGEKIYHMDIEYGKSLPLTVVNDKLCITYEEATNE